MPEPVLTVLATVKANGDGHIVAVPGSLAVSAVRREQGCPEGRSPSASRRWRLAANLLCWPHSTVGAVEARRETPKRSEVVTVAGDATDGAMG